MYPKGSMALILWLAYAFVIKDCSSSPTPAVGQCQSHSTFNMSSSLPLLVGIKPTEDEWTYKLNFHVSLYMGFSLELRFDGNTFNSRLRRGMYDEVHEKLNWNEHMFPPEKWSYFVIYEEDGKVMAYHSHNANKTDFQYQIPVDVRGKTFEMDMKAHASEFATNCQGGCNVFSPTGKFDITGGHKYYLQAVNPPNRFCPEDSCYIDNKDWHRYPELSGTNQEYSSLDVNGTFLIAEECNPTVEEHQTTSTVTTSPTSIIDNDDIDISSTATSTYGLYVPSVSYTTVKHKSTATVPSDSTTDVLMLSSISQGIDSTSADDNTVSSLATNPPSEPFDNFAGEQNASNIGVTDFYVTSTVLSQETPSQESKHEVRISIAAKPSTSQPNNPTAAGGKSNNNSGVTTAVIIVIIVVIVVIIGLVIYKKRYRHILPIHSAEVSDDPDELVVTVALADTRPLSGNLESRGKK